MNALLSGSIGLRLRVFSVGSWRSCRAIAYYAVESIPSPRVVVVAVGVKLRERLRIGGRDVEP